MSFFMRFPFSAILGQEELKLSLMLSAVNPRIGGVLIRGEKGTAKSTAVRALAALLPEIRVVRGCPFQCDPEELCENCRNRKQPLEAMFRRVAVVDLPLNATEDRVVGGIDFSRAVQKGSREFQPGLLAAAHRGILYVDEINLLDDHLLDIILDAAASGQNVVEREGISFRHPCRFILVGTMNPEEGELRPQLLDRFGLCVETCGAEAIEDRVALMERREEFDQDPAAFLQRYAEKDRAIARKIKAAGARLSTVHMPQHLRGFISELSMENNVAGHRADLVIEQAALALAALEGASEVTADHIGRVAPLALVHRRREAQPPPPAQPQQSEERQDERQNAQQEEQPSENEPAHGEQDGREKAPGPAESSEPTTQEDRPAPEEALPKSEQEGERIFDIGPTFRVKPLVAPEDRVFRRGSGRRSRSRVFQKQGRYVKSSMRVLNNDLALDATLRAAAPYQKRRGKSNGLAVTLTDQDLRGKIRERRIGHFLFFTVDASGSMGARGRMAASKGAVMSLLLDAYQKRDRVALISFRRNEAVVNLPPTPSVELAGRLLAEMPVGGRTPLSAGLAKTCEQVRSVLLKDPAARPIVILITDGKSNVALGGGNPMEEALRLSTAMSRDSRVRYVVVDTEEQGLITFGLARRLAAALGADYFKIETLKAQTLINIVRGKNP